MRSIHAPDSLSDGQDLLASPSLWGRLSLAVLVAVAGLPVVPWPYILGWALAWFAVSACEQLLARHTGYAKPTPTGLALTFGLSTLGALAAAVLIALGDGAARFFAVALIGFSTVNILLRYYSTPRMLLAALSPHILVLAWIGWGLTAKYAQQGDWLRMATPLATLAVYVMLLGPARGRLMKAWRRVVEAKAAAEQASLAKSGFLATMSHEIRTPLNGVIGMAQAMQAEDLTERQRERIRVIRGCGETLLAILDDVLDLSKIEAGQLAIESAEFDLEHVTRGAVAPFAHLADKKGLDLRFSIADEAKGVFVGDRVRVRQILYNLVSNAVKFTDRGGVAVCVTYEDAVLRIEVADSGLGIAPQDCQRIFGRFVQGDGSITRRVGGAGLGLAICRQLAELMGGRIEVSSALGLGSVFVVHLPLERVSGPRVFDGAEPGPATPAPSALRILAAEDNDVNRLVLSTLLDRGDLTLTLVENGAAAVEAWRAADWDVILMDIQMPVMDGVTAARTIRAEETASRRSRTPIVAVTANVMPHQQAEYRGAGMDLVVPKPLQVDKLFGALEVALSGGAEAEAEQAA
jgi:signal transduction histidine kinase/CheY-like chemotaxis protein